MSSLIDAAFAALDPAEWSGATPARMPLATVRDRLRHGLCPGCGRRPPAPRGTMCGPCLDAGLAYCPTCEAVAPVAEFAPPTPSRAARGGRYGEHRPCKRARDRRRIQSTLGGRERMLLGAEKGRAVIAARRAAQKEPRHAAAD